jgi:hypothetical protein
VFGTAALAHISKVQVIAVRASTVVTTVRVRAVIAVRRALDTAVLVGIWCPSNLALGHDNGVALNDGGEIPAGRVGRNNFAALVARGGVAISALETVVPNAKVEARRAVCPARLACVAVGGIRPISLRTVVASGAV